MGGDKCKVGAERVPYTPANSKIVVSSTTWCTSGIEVGGSVGVMMRRNPQLQGVIQIVQRSYSCR